MRRSQSSSEHAEAVSRRLATLSAELAAVRGEPEAAGPGGEGPTHTRVRDRGEPPAPVVLPVPGRHASRRLRVGGLQLGPLHLALVAVVAALAVGLAAWWAVRDQAEAVPLTPETPAGASPLAALPSAGGSTAGSSGSASGAGTSTGTSTADVVVDVAGKVRRPGIAVLPPGSRVVDAIEAAGGARRGVDLSTLNLARVVVDGEQILVGPAPVAGVAGSVGAPAAGDGALVSLNAADQAALESLPGVGPVTAEAILAWRTEHGAFTSVDELLEVDGIGEATLADIAPHVTL